MTKTNLEIEEEFNKYFLDCIRNRFGVARFEGDSELLRDDISKFWLPKLQQRMDEIEGEVKKMLKEIPEDCGKSCSCLYCDPTHEYNKIIRKVLNIIKSVDKNK